MNERRYQRASLAMPIRLKGPDGSVGHGLAWDISLCGVFVELSLPFPKVGSIVELQIELPNSEEPVRCKGRVTRLATNPASGCGVELEWLDAESGDRIEAFVVTRSRFVRQLKRLLDQPDTTQDQLDELVNASGMDLPTKKEALAKALERHLRYFRIRNPPTP